MKKIKIKAEDKKLIEAYFKWSVIKGFDIPMEFEFSRLIENMNCDHRQLVEDYVYELKIKHSLNYYRQKRPSKEWVGA